MKYIKDIGTRSIVRNSLQDFSTTCVLHIAYPQLFLSTAFIFPNIFSLVHYSHISSEKLDATPLASSIIPVKKLFNQKRFYIRGTLTIIRIHRLAKIPILLVIG